MRGTRHTPRRAGGSGPDSNSRSGTLVILAAFAALSTPGPALQERVSREESPEPADPQLPVEITNSIGMQLRRIPAGSFSMGSETGQPDESPIHEVRLSAFYIGKYEVTQREYELVTGQNPSRYRSPTRPVETVDWAAAVGFCERLSQREGILYRLPTEAEWEYAARGGVDGAEFIWGEDALPIVDGVKQANVADDEFRASFRDVTVEEPMIAAYNDGFATTAPVGSFSPNRYGLYDMIGNVFEWCADHYVLGTRYYLESPTENPAGPAAGADRVLRGASWWAAPVRYYRVASRFRASPDHASPAVGFRCVREIRPDSDRGTARASGASR